MRLPIEVIAVQPVDHCNFHCRGCNHAAPLLPPTVHQAEEYIPALLAIKQVADVKYVHISGGEPSLHPNLREFVAKIRAVHPKLRFFTNGSWFPQAADRVTSVLPLVSDLVLTVHPESKQTPSEMWKIANQLAKQFQIYATVWKQGAFAVATFTNQPNGRRGCSLQYCHVLRADGKLGRCGVMSLHPPAAASDEFNVHRAESLYDPFRGSEEQLRKWRSALPPCCQFCNYDRATVPHYIAKASALTNA